MSFVLRNARIWTACPERPRAGSVAIEDGRITALDTEANGGDVIDARGATVVPGLIDAHVHLLMGGEALGDLDLSAVASRDEFEAAIARRHETLGPDEWLIARGWSEENWPHALTPDKTWLAAAGDRPVVCYRMDLHAALVNDAVLRQCDLARAEAPGWGGRVVRAADTGAPTGLMVESAAWELVNPLVPAPGVDARRAALYTAERHFLRHGVTTVGTMEYGHVVENVYVPLRDGLRVRCRVTLLDRGWPMSFDYGRDFRNDDRLAVIGYKAFVDGTLGSRSARLLADYADDPGNRGMLVELAAAGDLGAWALGVAAAGLSPSIHAIGDEAARLALDAVEPLDSTCAPRIEHAQQLAIEDIPRFAGRLVSMQPLHKADDGRFAERRLGRARLAGTFAFRRLAEAGARLAFGSDWPVVSCDPMAGIRAAVTGRTFDGAAFLTDQNLQVEEALHAYTAGAADALALDAGRLRPGALGDLVVLDRDPFGADWDHAPPRVTMTISGGEVVHDGREGTEVMPSHA